jgi:hypothetical protein
MNKKFLHDFNSYRDEKKSAIKEGMSIYEFEDETQTEPEMDLDFESEGESEGDDIEVDLDAATPPATEPVKEEDIDFGDGATISHETAVSELEFITGIVAQYTKLAKKEVKLDDSMKAKIRKAFEIFK